MLLFQVNLPAQEAPAKKDSCCESRKIEGWTVQTSRKLLDDKTTKPAADLTLELLAGQLGEIVRLLPAPAVESLRKVTIWISPEYAGTSPKAEYHPDVEWLTKNGRNPGMVKSVEITNTSIFEAELRRMPMLMLHELAHAYHDQVLGFENAEIRKTYQKAVLRGNYKAVERTFGKADRPNKIETAYALSNEKEYFAEGTEAFFGRNDFFPFTRDQLKTHDPDLYKLLEKVWNPAPAAPKAS